MRDRANIEFGIRLDCLFTIHRKKKKDVINKLGICRNSLTNWIYGRQSPSVEFFMELCNELGATEEEILHCLKAFKKDAV